MCLECINKDYCKKVFSTIKLDKNISLTLSNIKRGTDLGTLVVPFNLNVPPITSMTSEIESFKSTVILHRLKMNKMREKNSNGDYLCKNNILNIGVFPVKKRLGTEVSMQMLVQLDIRG